MSAQCIECEVVRDGDCWELGEVCLFGMLFACSPECAAAWAAREAREGYRPGEPNYDAEIVVPVIVIDAASADAFTAEIENPSPPTKALVDLMRAWRPYEPCKEEA